ncbi:complex I NDUFA9 subunit family protein [Alicyclobacillus dauci]|uniref:Complex I NDUFA9 subunit family protein n=1 Tax=Alicyclobacillus dauci TaxID=1475485 RepID=A0ABY6YYW0_9BACL|nr:complex I NDUFA9 subunit family protein [Alicyclobacillus dauci]WAH35156.1 complex I NDUFA9 subunit family protein [Alicyclobacillus dauci]
MNVFVTGGTGYVGQPIVRQLVEKGHHVTLLTRSEHRSDGLPKCVEIVIGDVFDDTALKLGMNQAEAVIHLVGIIREQPRRGLTMQRVHVEGTRHVIAAALRLGVYRFVHMSALGAKSDAVSSYHRTKWEAEKCLRQSGLKFTIFRPSVVFGPGGPGPNFLSQLVDVTRLPVIPVVGDGNYPLQPVHTRTIAGVFEQALTLDTTIGETFEVGGPNVVSHQDIMSKIEAALDIQKPHLQIPISLIQAMVRCFGWTGKFPLTRDQLSMLVEGNVCTNPGRLYDSFDVDPIPFTVNVNHDEKNGAT